MVVCGVAAVPVLTGSALCPRIAILHTIVHKLTETGASVGRLGEADVAVALVAAGGVAAVPVLAQRRVVGALVYVHALVTGG